MGGGRACGGGIVRRYRRGTDRSARKPNSLRCHHFEFFLRDRGNEIIRIDCRPGSQREDLPGIRIHHHDGAPLRSFLENLLSQSLDINIKGRDDVVSGFRRNSDSFTRFISVLVKSNIELTRLAAELVLTCLLKSLAAFAFRPERLVILQNSCTLPAGAPGVSDDLTRQRSLRVSPHIDRPQRHAWRHLTLGFRHFVIRKISGDVEWNGAPVPVVLNRSFFRKSNRTDGQSAGRSHRAIDEVDHLPVGKIKWCRENDAQIVADPCLRQRNTISIGDLTSRGRNVQGIGCSLALRLPSRRQMRRIRRVGGRRLLRPCA